MNNNHFLKFKEKSPQETVKQIQTILKEIGIEVEEKWISENEIGTYSLRLSLKGAPGVGSNGKGVTKAFARASAYAEFMERMQNMRMSQLGTLIRICEREKSKFVFYPNETILTSEELVKENNAFIQMFFEKRELTNATFEEKVNALLKVQQFDFKILKEYNKFLCVPYYSVREQKMCNIPYLISSCYYASNGMCAGNTVAEALVQGLSEILERRANNRVLTEYTSLPDVPEEKIREFPEVYKMYEILKNSDKFLIQVKDASYGGIFPVVALVLIEKNTSMFGVKFGAHPDIGIALERIFTEATQGITLEEFSHKSELSFMNEEVGKDNNLINSFRSSDAQYPYQMLLKPSTYQYYDFPKVNECENSDLLKVEIEKIMNQGYDILIHNCSYTGFGSYQIIVPGLSEMGVTNDEVINKMLERFNLQYALFHPKFINEAVCYRMIDHLREAGGNVFENTLSYFGGMYCSYPYPGREDYVDLYYFMVMCALRVREYEFAAEVVSVFIQFMKKLDICVNKKYIALKKYIDGMKEIGQHDKVLEYLRYMFDKELCDEYDELLKEPDKILTKIYPELSFDREYLSEYRCYESMIHKMKKYESEHNVSYEDIMSEVLI